MVGTFETTAFSNKISSLSTLSALNLFEYSSLPPGKAIDILLLGTLTWLETLFEINEITVVNDLLG
jgi:hypothetical protein